MKQDDMKQLAMVIAAYNAGIPTLISGAFASMASFDGYRNPSEIVEAAKEGAGLGMNFALAIDATLATAFVGAVAGGKLYDMAQPAVRRGFKHIQKLGR